jgi:hypothetical protein
MDANFPRRCLQKPWQIHYAVALLWLAFAQITVSILAAVPQFDRDAEVDDNAPVLTIFLVILALLIPSVSKGRRWARFSLVVFTVFGISMDINNIAEILNAGPFWTTLDLIGDFALIAAACLINVRPGSEWFAKQRID